MAPRLRSLAALAVIVSTVGIGTACESCGDVNCGAGLIVWWRPNAVPEGDYELCIDSQCEPVDVQSQQGLSLVEPSSAGAGEGQTVTLSVTTPDGSVTQYSGSGSLRGRCCEAIILQAGMPGQLLDEQFD